MLRRTSPRLAAFVGMAGLTACSSSAAPGAVPSIDAGAEAASGPTCSAATACSPASPDTDAAGWTCVKTVDATVLDTNHDPVGSFVATTCGANLCETAASDATGRLHFDVCELMDRPAFKVDGGKSYVSFAVPITSDVVTVPPAVLVPLPAEGAAFQTGTAQSLVSNGVTLTVAAGATVTIDPLLSSDEQLFRAAPVPSADTPPSVDPALGLEVLVGLAPLDARVSPPAALTFPNTAAWPAGVEVELYLHGVDLTSSAFAPYGGWAPIGTGHVSADGSTVSTDPGQGNGVPELSLVGARRKS